MITLTDSLAALLRTSNDTSFYVLITKLTAGNWADGYSKHVYSQRPLNHSSAISGARYIEDRMNKKSIRDASFGVDARKRGSLGQVGTLEFTIADEDHFMWDLNQSGIYYEGHKVELWFRFTASAAGASDILWWSGEVADVKRDPVQGVATVEARTSDSRNSKTVPPNQWDETDQTLEHLRGVRKPLLLGVHELVEGLKIANVSSLTSIYGGIYGPAIQFADPALGTLSALSSLVWGDEGLVEATGGTAEIRNASSPWSTVAAECKAYFLTSAAAKLHLRLRIPLRHISTGGTQSATILDVDLPGMVDGDDLSYVDFSQTYSGSKTIFFKVPSIGITGDIPDHPATLIPKVYICLKVSAYGGTAACNSATQLPTYCLSLCFVDNKDDLNGQTAGPRQLLDLGTSGTPVVHDSALWDETITFDLDGGTYAQLQTLAALGNGYIAICLRNANNSMNTTYGTINARIFEMRGIVVYAEMEFPGGGYYASAQGYKDDGSGTVSGTPNLNIERPGDVAAWLAYKLSGAGTNILWSDFRAIEASRPLWTLARRISDESESDELLEEVADTGMFHIWCDRNGKLRAFVADTAALPTFTLARGQVIKGRIVSAEKTPIEDVATSFTVRAMQHPLTEAWQITKTCSPTASSSDVGSTYRDLCAAARDTYCGGREVTMDVDLDWVRNSGTARAYLIELIARCTRRWWIIKFDVDLEMLTVEIGDQFRFAPAAWTDLPPDLGSSQFVVTGLDLQADTDKIRITALQTVD